MIDYSRNESGQLLPQTAIIGLGGAGNNILDQIEAGDSAHWQLYSAGLDLRLLKATKTPQKIQLGEWVTHGLGSGGDPQLGEKAARESESALKEIMSGNDLVILLTGLGGGTGSGAAPLMARLAKQSGAYTVVIAVKPFSFEGERRKEQAETALQQLYGAADMVLCFENDRIERLLEGEQKALAAFEAANNLLARAAKSIPMLAANPGLFHLGLDDLKAVVRSGPCLIGICSASGEDRSIEAARQVLSCPLFSLEDGSRMGGHVLVHIAGPGSLTLKEIEAAMDAIATALPDDTQIHFGVAISPQAGEEVTVMAFASVNALSGLPVSAPVKNEAAPAIIPDPVYESTPARSLQPEAEDRIADRINDDAPEFPVSEAQLESVIRYDESLEESPLSHEVLQDGNAAHNEPVDYPQGTVEPEEDIREEDDLDADEDEGPVGANDQPVMGEFSFDLTQAAPSNPPLTERKPAPVPESEHRNASAYEEPTFKGLFSDDDPFIVDGEDLDLPPSMRKKH